MLSKCVMAALCSANLHKMLKSIAIKGQFSIVLSRVFSRAYTQSIRGAFTMHYLLVVNVHTKWEI